MKKGIHPEYREVVFYDAQGDFKFLTRSTTPTKQTIEHEGKEYPLVKLEISSATHPFYTGSEKHITEGSRVDKFTKKYGGNYFTKAGGDKK